MNKKIVFMGTPNISGHILKSLYQNGYNIELVYTQPPVAVSKNFGKGTVRAYFFW